MRQAMEKVICKFVEVCPLLIVGVTMFPCGLVMGRIFFTFAAEADIPSILHSGPLAMGTCCALFTAILLVLLKYFRSKIIYCHIDVLLTAAGFNLIASGFFFAENLDIVGSFLSFLAHGLTFVSSLSYLHIISGRKSRARSLSLALLWYIFGVASAISILTSAYTTTTIGKKSWIYSSFAWLFLPCALLILVLLVILKVMHFLGHLDYKSCFDNDVRIANSNGTLFDNRQEVIKRVHFFYVTRSKQWQVALILIFVDAIQFALFTYFMFWLSLNDAVRLTKGIGMHLMMWIVLLGTVVGTTATLFFCIKVIFIAAAVAHVVVTILGMILFATIETHVSFWFMCFLFGVPLATVKIATLEVSNFRIPELLLFLIYFANNFTIGGIYFYFVSDAKNSFFYSQDSSTLAAHGFTFLIITCLTLIIVSLEVPRTFNMPLFDIQYNLMGIIFKEHQIEQLNVRYLNDGTIPTITRSSTAGV